MNGRNNESSVTFPPDTVGQITQLLTRWNAKSPSDQAELLKLLYPELRRLAGLRMRRERLDHTLQPTALVNEFVLQLCAATNQPAQNRSHFLAIASRAMRRILVDYARAHNSEKRGGQVHKLSLEEADIPRREGLCSILEIHNLLEHLSTEDPRMAEIIELRYFGGLSNAEIAETLGIAPRTVKRDWQVGRAWLFSQLQKAGPHVA